MLSARDQDSVESRRRWHLPAALAVFAACYAAWHVGWFVQSKSATFDETFYLNCALQTAQDGRIDPRLARAGVAPLGALLGNLPVAMAVGGEDRDQAWQAIQGHREWNRCARVLSASIVLSLLGLVVFRWLNGEHGVWAGVSGLWMLAASPTILAHSSLAATDAPFALAALVGLLVIARYCQRRTWGAWLMMAAAIAIAVSTKYSGVFLLPVAMAVSVIDHWAAAQGGVAKTTVVARAVVATIGLTIVVLILCWACNGFAMVGLPDRTLAETPLLMRPAPIHGVIYQVIHNRGGHHSYLMGQFSMSSWWYYYPVTLLLKSTLVELLLLVVAVSWLVLRTCFGKHRCRSLQTLLLGAFVLTALAMRARIGIGHRYLLTLYPILVMAGVAWLFSVVTSARIRGASLGVMIAGQILSSSLAAPHQLSYFNVLVGGARQGGDWLVDSNLDWGQDLPALATELERLQCDGVLIQYFGTTDPALYGIQAFPLNKIRPEHYARFDCIAVSETFLRGGYCYGRDPFRRLRDLPEAAQAGHSIRIYRLDSAVLEALAAAARAGLPGP